jgi:hypothetical protein
VGRHRQGERRKSSGLKQYILLQNKKMARPHHTGHSNSLANLSKRGARTTPAHLAAEEVRILHFSGE